jgi:hypothetical protein
MTVTEPTQTASTIDQARAIAAAGLRVLPIKPGRKNPPMKSWQTAASVDEKAINAWWNGLYRDHGIGIAMGPQPDGRNIFAIDIDTHDEDANGYDTIAELEDTHGPLPDTVTSVTGSGGAHQLYAAPAGAIIRNQQSAGQRVGPGVDIRGDGGQIVVAPTIHPDTHRVYQWQQGRAPWEHVIADAPKWLLDMVTDQPAPPAPTKAPTVDLYAGPDEESPADALRRRWNWRDELARAGWQEGHTTGDDTYYTRPGKEVRKGHSAVLHGDDGPFVIFTTEIPASLRQLGHAVRKGEGFAFSPFEWYAAHQHAGSLSDASRALRAEMSPPMPTTAATPQTANEGPPVAPEPTFDETLAAMLIDWGEFWNQDHKAAEWLAEPVLAQGRSTAIFAPGGTGKSLLSLYMAACIATGRKLFGRPVDPHNVLYLDYEMTADDLAERLEQMGFGDDCDLSRLHYALLPSLPGLDEPEGGKAVVRMAEMVDAALVVIDTFGRAVHGDENDADTVRSWYRWTGLHLKHDGRAFLRVDHAGKDTTKGQRGTSAKNDDVDVVWEMRAKEAGTFTLIAKKRRMGWVPMTVDLVMTETAELRFDLAHGHVWPKGTAEAAKALDALSVAVDCTVKQAREALKDAGRTASSEALSNAVKYRKEANSLYHFAGQKPVDNHPDEPRNAPRNALDGDDAERSDGTTERIANPLVDDAERETERRGTPSDATAERRSSLKGERVPSVPADDMNPDPTEAELLAIANAEGF